MTIELSVTIKDCERTLKKDYLIYEPVTFVHSDPILMKCVNDAIEEFKGEIDDIKVRATMVFK